jgi:hypothetical protein
MPKIHTTISLQVSPLFVCEPEIAVHSVSTSPEDCAFVDHEGLNDRLTLSSSSTEQMPCCDDFRHNVIQRDGHACVVTQDAEDICDVVHLIPWSNGEEVRFL